MTSPRHFPQFTLQRLNSVLTRLSGQIWHSPVPVGLSKAAETNEPVPFSRLKKVDFQSVEAPLHWGRLFHYTWFRLDLPRSTDSGQRYLRWREQGEATLYVGGKPFYGFDVAHRCAPIPDGIRTAHVESMCCQSAIWHPSATGLDEEGSCLEGAEVVLRNDEAWHAWHDLVVLREVLVAQIEALPDAQAYLTERPGVRPPFGKLPAWVRSVIDSIDRAIDDWETKGLPALRKSLARLYRRFPAEWHQLRATMVGHAHIDLVWLWPEGTGESKAVHTFATVLRLMETYPEFRFSYSQPASYEAVTRLTPELVEPIRERIDQGRWEMLGAAYVESDTVLTSGEGLLRSLMMGQESRTPWTLDRARVLWLPDVFGYAGCLPQLMKMADIDWFYTNKVAWRRVTPFPHSSFRWRGTDGTEVLAHVSFEVNHSYNGTATVKELHDAVLTQKQSAVHREALVPTGYGDGGGGPTEEMCERARRLANLVSVPKAEWGGVEQFFDRMESVQDELPVWSGEIYLEMHRGTYTTQSHMKSAYRAAERGLQTWEAVHCATGHGGIDREMWKRVIFAQFHDALPGSSYHETYAELVPELEQIADGAVDRASQALAGPKGEACLFNPLPQTVSTVVRDEEEGDRMISVPSLSGVSADAPAIDGLSSVSVKGHTLSNDRTRVVFNSAGEIRSMSVDGSPVALTESGGQFWVYPDHPHDFDAWEIDHDALRLGTRTRGGRLVESSGDGGVAGDMVFERTLPDDAGSVRIRYQLRAGEPYIRVSCEVDWQKTEALLRIVFPTDYRGSNARFGAPFGSVLRPQMPGRPGDEAYWESPASRWAMVTDDGEGDGFYLVTEAKYGFEAKEGSLAVTLLKSAAQTGERRQDASSAPSSLRVSGRARFTDLGIHRIDLAFGRFDSEAPREEMPASLADTLYTLPIAYQGDPVQSGFIGVQGGASLVPAWARPFSKERWLLRLHETLGRRGEAQIQLEPGYVLEAVGVGDTLRDETSTRIQFKPYQVLSFMIRKP